MEGRRWQRGGECRGGLGRSMEVNIRKGILCKDIVMAREVMYIINFILLLWYLINGNMMDSL